MLHCPFTACNAPIGQHQQNNYIGISRCSVCNRSFSMYYAKGKILLKNQEYENAVKNFLIALKFFKNTAEVHIDLAEALNHISSTKKDEIYDGVINRRNEAINRAIEIDEHDMPLETILKMIKMIE